MPCERLFSRAKEVSTDKRTRLGADVFEALQSLHYLWLGNIPDYARLKSLDREEVDMMDFEMMAQEEVELYSSDFSEDLEEA